jgi:pimeloyl-ACP methyl ester carboxylesterase
MNRQPTGLLFLACLLLAPACATPIGVVRGGTEEVHRELTANVLSAGRASEWSTQVLHRNNLFERFGDDPAGTLAALHQLLRSAVTVDRLFALAELSFLHAERSGQHDYYLAAAAYAYAFLLPEHEESPIRPIDPRGRLAVDLYNLGISRGLRDAGGETVVLEAGTRTLPFGELTLTTRPSDFVWSGYRFARFVSVGEYVVRGLRNRYRQAGVGAPLAATVEPATSDGLGDVLRRRIPPRIKVPVTAFVRFTAPLRSLLDGRLQAAIELYTFDQATTVRVGERDVPLELEPTAVLAYQLEGAPVWDMELAGFRVAEPPLVADGLIMLHPYRFGRIPVVLVHGTASSPARWAEMYNELQNDPVLRGRYQYWLFQYSTGQPILYSATLLRRALRAVIAEVDPEGKDAALRRMVIVGHSQGGLLTKLMAIDSGTRFWDNVSREPFEQLHVSADTRDLLRDAMFFKPFPDVERVVFVATPHRGSFRAVGWVVDVVRRLVTLPARLVLQLDEVLKAAQFAHLSGSRLPTSVDNMSPGHRFIRTLADIPIDPRITAHSIIAVKRSGPLIGQTDGVVGYESAHLEGVASELVVRSGHSMQSHPETIQEMRRILREHLATRPSAPASGASRTPSDSGPGIAADILGSIFKPFVKTKKDDMGVAP